MIMKRSKTVLVLTAFLCLCVFFASCFDTEASAAAKPASLNVALYKSLPDYFTFEKKVEACWKEQHPDVKLNFVYWNCYSGEVPDDLDVFVFDTQSLDAFARKGYLLSLSEEDIQDYDALAQEYPIYAGLKEIATVPDACIFRIQPDGDAYIDESVAKADLLPSLTK